MYVVVCVHVVSAQANMSKRYLNIKIFLIYGQEHEFLIHKATHQSD